MQPRGMWTSASSETPRFNRHQRPIVPTLVSLIFLSVIGCAHGPSPMPGTAPVIGRIVSPRALERVPQGAPIPVSIQVVGRQASSPLPPTAWLRVDGEAVGPLSINSDGAGTLELPTTAWTAGQTHRLELVSQSSGPMLTVLHGLEVWVEENQPPRATLVRPSTQGTLSTLVPVVVALQVYDRETPLEAMKIRLEVDGTAPQARVLLKPGTTGHEGLVQSVFSLPSGRHQLSVTVLDSGGKSVTLTRALTLEDPSQGREDGLALR